MRIGRPLAVIVSGLAVAGIVTSCRLATVFTVNSVIDAPDATVGDGVCASAADGCTLRAALQEANAHTGPAQIVLAGDQRYELTVAGTTEDASATGDLDVSRNITIAGHGATIDAGGIDRVIQVLAGGALTLRDLTVTGGVADFGGGLRIDQGGSAQISGSTIVGNVANGFQRCWNDALGLGLGGCSWEDQGVGNPYYEHVGTGGGGGIWNFGTVSVSSSTISANTIPDDAQVDGCWPFIHAIICDIHQGAGVLNYGTANLVNVTLSGNSVSRGFGAAVATNTGGLTTLIFVTISANAQTSPSSGAALQTSPTAGAPPTTVLIPSSGSTVVGAASVAGTVIDGVGPLCSQSLATDSLGYNVASDATCFSGGTDRAGTPSDLGPLADNGGPTLTHLPLTGSALIDSIPADASPCGSVIHTDQRGAARLSGQPCTIGSVEP
ncbi:MAG: choice-of-anchor Q domain-containing protein [Acidimicrobiales bacterium]